VPKQLSKPALLVSVWALSESRQRSVLLQSPAQERGRALLRARVWPWCRAAQRHNWGSAETSWRS